MGYIHDHYSPPSSRKFLPKSKSVDRHQNGGVTDAPSRTEVDNFKYFDNSKSSPDVNKSVVVSAAQKLEITKNNFLNNLLRKFDNKLGQKAVKTISRVAKKTNDTNAARDGALPNRTFPNKHDVKQDDATRVQDKELSPNYRNEPIISRNWPPVPSELTLRKHSDVSGQITRGTHTKELPKETPESRASTDNRAKIKYSPPPENAASPKTISADRSGSASNALVVRSRDSPVRAVDNMFRGGRKLKERFVVGLSVAAVLFTLLLVVDLQMDLGMSGKHLVPSHGRIKYVVQEEGPGSAYNRFRNRLLQKTHR